jgi:hypothetical protein
MIIVSNTSPINYLILIGQINLLPELFGAIIIPRQSTANCPMHLPPHLSKLGLQPHPIGSKFSLSASRPMQFSIYSTLENAQPFF